ncbi:amino acid ABC transporter permease [Hydrogenophaga sp.]|uniref:amino acid ABC transporter permease n=1 Tax=Hydrogenophaga sp. TaxID=1904254 RepID=UPI00286E8438|nr:amino acid ABC transporter permease [Hydrogenophaga sp.]
MQYQFDFSFLATTWPRFLHGAWLTIQLATIAIVLGFVLGAVCALARTNGTPAMRRLVGGYVEAIRNTPLLVQIFLVYFGLSSLGFQISAELCAALALTINIGAYSTEILRAGIESVARSQVEAGECLGLSRLQVYWHVVLLPAVERVYPALSSQFVLLMLASSVTSQISAEELTAAANLLQSETFRSFEVYIVVALVYLALSFLFRGAFWAVGRIVFVRRRRLGTSL